MVSSKGKKRAPVKRTPARSAPRVAAKRAQREPAKRGRLSATSCIVGIGASAGGLDAIREFLTAMPPDSGLAFIVIQHLDPRHKSLAPELFAKCTAMPVTQVADGIQVKPNHVYTAPAGSMLSIVKGLLRLAPAADSQRQHLPIDHFFHALGGDQHERAIGVILSGSGADGALGLRTIVQNGGMVIAQQPESAQFDGMPRSAIQTGLVSSVMPIAKMPQVLIDYARHPYAAGSALFANPAGGDAAALGRIMELVRSRCGFDFGGYRRATLLRRTQRRMGLKGIKHLGEYANALAADSQEAHALFKDMLIGVTEFFRDQAAWDTLDTEVIGPLIKSKETDETIRVWSAGIATGEEAYSIAMLLIERLEEAGKHCPIQIFASDTNEDALEIARTGIYPAGIAARLSGQRLRRFFAVVPDSHHYQASEALRSTIVFCAHNLLRDPPYSKMDLVSCRNLLIYLEPEIQKKAIGLMHFALRPDGYLFLGAAETLGECEDIFRPISKKWRIFQRRGAARRIEIGLPMPHGKRQASGGALQAPVPRVVDAAALVQRLMMARFVPAAVLTDGQFNALYFLGATDRFLAQPKGGPTQDLLALAREGLRSRLRNAIRRAEAKKLPVVVSDARVRRGSAFEPVKLTVTPAGRTKEHDELLLVVFEDALNLAPVLVERDSAAASLIKQLEEDLRATRDDLSSALERQENAVESLRTSNEEVVSANEELQSMNEELESSREELQSLNEELNTVNQQLLSKIDELQDADSDLQNLLASSEIATVCLDTDFRLKWFSPAARDLFKLVPSDVGRPAAAFAPMLSDASVIEIARKVIADGIRVEHEVRSDAQRWFLRRVLPYRMSQDKISGVIFSFTDITEIRLKAESELAANSAQSQLFDAQIEKRLRLLRIELFKLATSEERERREIATELHDAICQPLAAVNLRLTARQDGGAAAGKPPDEVTDLVESAERAARALIYRISPPVLFDMGLGPALEWLAEEMQRSYHLVVKVSGVELSDRLALDDTVRSVLFRCVRELLVNVAKHAKVHAAEVSISMEGEAIAVRVSDAGSGFDSSVLASHGAGGRFGLVSVRERAGFVDGKFTIQSIPGDGTVATITVPLTTRNGPRHPATP